jgi:hypothetical protein
MVLTLYNGLGSQLVTHLLVCKAYFLQFFTFCHLSVGLPDGEAWVQWWRALYQTSRCLALRMVILGLCAAARLWKPISGSSRGTALVLMLLPEEVWNSVVSIATKDRWFLRATCFSTWRSSSVSFCGLPLHGLAAAAPRRFHFTITAPTVARATQAGQKFDELNCWKGGILVWCHVESHSSVRPFYCQWLSLEIAWLCVEFYTPVSNGCGWNSQFH